MSEIEKVKKDPLFAEERKNIIVQMVNENMKLVVSELCSYLNVSPATIRNDLRELETAGLLKRTHGGAISNAKAGFEPDSYEKEIMHQTEKNAIAEQALKYVEDGDTIAIDTGTTTLEFAKVLITKRDITVVLNDITIADYLEKNTSANIILISGIIRRKFHCTVGPMAVKALNGLSVDKAFMATNGISLKRGLTTPDLNQAEVKKAMIEIASEVIVLCDSSKIKNIAFTQVVPINKIGRLITDEGIEEQDVAEFRNAGIEVDIVKV